MAQSSSNPNFGPLPTHDRYAQNEESSIRALRNALSVDKFVFRDERINDAGVDGSIELLSDSMSTNLRAQVQLKGADTDKPNKDGSISYSVKVSNLNYLLNGQSPLYVLFIVPRQELRYVWAHDERKRIEEANTDWLTQQDVTLHFVNVLNAASLDNIYERILREARFQRSVHETLSRFVPTDQVVIGVTPSTLQHTDPAQLKNILEKGGVALIASGYAIDVVESLSLLNTSVVNQAYFLLLRSYAEYTLARYDDALGVAKRAMLSRTNLSDDNQQFLDLLKSSCELQTGRITLEEYEQRKEDWQQQLTGEYALGQRLEYLRHAIVNAHDLADRTRLTSELRTVVEQILAEPQVSEPSKLQTRLGLLYAEGQQFLFDLLNKLSSINLRSGTTAFRNPQRDLRVLHQLAQRWAQCMKDMDAAIQDAIKQQYPLLLAEALVYRSIIISVYLANVRIVSLGSGVSLPDPPGALETAQKGAEQAANIYRKSGHFEGEMRAKVASTDLLYLAGNEQEAQALAAQLLPQARIMGYEGFVRQIEGTANGHSILKDTLERIQQANEDDYDVVASNYDENFIEEAAKRLQLVYDLPDGRMPTLKNGILAMRDIARERISWCRYIELLEDLAHTENRNTYYLVDPDRHCRCQKYDYESLIGDPDWNIITNTFKQTYCANCPSRSPKMQGGK